MEKLKMHLQQQFYTHSQLYAKKEISGERLYHGRGKFLPDFSYFTIDFFPPYLLFIFYRPPSDDLLQLLISLYRDLFEDSLKGIYCQRRDLEKSPMFLIYGEAVSEFVTTIEGFKFSIKFGQSQNVGFFLDMKEGRDFLLANSQDKNVLNLFAYTCALSVFAIKGGARQVINMDMSKGAILRGRMNHELNHCDGRRLRFYDCDIFKSFGRIKRDGPYDLIIIDPPTDHGSHFKIERDYPKLIRRSHEWLKEGGQLMAVLNSPHKDFLYLQKLVEENAPDLVLLEKKGFPPQFLESNPDSGLKILIWKKA